MHKPLSLEKFLNNVTSNIIFTIYCDGACSGNPGPGGWGGIIQRSDNALEYLISGYEAATTNNRMEMMAAIESLSVLPTGSKVEIYTDSTYLKDGINSWMKKWKLNGWMTSQKTPVKNKDLWIKLDEVNSTHQISWHWVKGHSTNVLNNRVDALARQAIITYSMQK